MNILADVKKWAGEAESLVSGAAASVTPVLGEIDDALKAINSVSTLINNFTTRLNTPEMQKASSADKLKAFSDEIQKHLAGGTQADAQALEKLEASS